MGNSINYSFTLPLPTPASEKEHPVTRLLVGSCPDIFSRAHSTQAHVRKAEVYAISSGCSDVEAPAIWGLEELDEIGRVRSRLPKRDPNSWHLGVSW